MRNWILILSLLMLAGCAGTGQPSVVADDANKGDAQAEEQVADASGDSANEVVCTREKKVGSNMYQRVCKTRRQLEAEREASQEQLRRDRSLQGAGAMQGGGG
jgi:hypothetical protein